MGAFLGLVGKIGWFRIRREADVCTSCGACDRACPVNLDVSTSTEVRSAECLSCSQCVLACPEKGALASVGPTKKKRSIGSRTAILATVGIFAAVVAAASVTGTFQWSIPTITETVAKTGSFEPEAIKGSDTFAAVAEAAGIPKEPLMERFGLSEAEFAAPMKEAAHRADSGFEVQDVRDFLKEKLEQ